MSLTDLENELKKVALSPEELIKLRAAGSLGMKIAIEDVERLFNQASNDPRYNVGYVAALREVLVFLRAMHGRAEKGLPTHGGSRVSD